MDLNDELLIKILSVVERNTNRPAYLCTDEEWAEALDEVMALEQVKHSTGTEVFEKARFLLINFQNLSPYQVDEATWRGAVTMARELLGITERAPVCPYCGSVAPYGDERHIWISVHQGKLHRWRWKRKENKR